MKTIFEHEKFVVAEQSKFGDDDLKEVCILRLFKCFTGHTGSPQQYSKACLYVFQNISTNWRLGLTKEGPSLQGGVGGRVYLTSSPGNRSQKWLLIVSTRCCWIIFDDISSELRLNVSNYIFTIPLSWWRNIKKHAVVFTRGLL